MAKYVIKQVLWVTIGLAAFSFIAFLTIELPTHEIYAYRIPGPPLSEEEIQWIADYTERFALDEPLLMRYVAWVHSVVLDGDWGYSMEWQQPVSALIYERFWLTLMLVLPVVVLSWLLAIPLGAVLAHRKSTLLDDLCVFGCRVSRCVPPFVIGLVVMWLAKSAYGRNMGGLFSEEYVVARWTGAKVADMLGHIWLPISILGLGNMAHSTLVMRGAMLREMSRSYVDGARVRGVEENALLRRYPLRVALGQFLAEERFAPARVLSAALLVAMVLSLQTTGPMMLRALTAQDRCLSGSFVFLVGFGCIIESGLVDIVRAVVDPRLRTSAWQPGRDPVVGR